MLISDDDEPIVSSTAKSSKKKLTSDDGEEQETCEEMDEDEFSTEENSGDEASMDEAGQPCTSHQAASRANRSRGRGQRKRTVKKANSNPNSGSGKQQQTVNECPKDYRPPEWLTSTKARKTPYVPQVDDEVVYFRQGHELYVEAVRQHGVYKIEDEDEAVPDVGVQEFCRVAKLSVKIGPPRLVCLKLAVLDPNTHKPTGVRFDVEYHDMPNVVDFVILRQFYERGIERHWKPKERFKCLIDDLWYVGVVEAKLPFQDEHPECEFQSLRIVWDSGEEEAMSPWDLEPLSGVNSRKSKPVSAASGLAVEPQPLTADEIKSMLYVPVDDEWPEHGRDYECERILKVTLTRLELLACWAKTN